MDTCGGTRGARCPVGLAGPTNSANDQIEGDDPMLRTKKTKTKKAATGKPSKLPIPRRFPVNGDTPAKLAKGAREAAPPPEAAAEATDGPTKATVAAPAPATPTTAGKLSCLDAAAEVLRAAGTSMRCRELVAAMAERDLWTSTAPTPHQTLASALLREITKKGADSRFRRADRVQFALNA